MAITAIRFRELRSGKDTEIGRAVLQEDGTAKLSGVPAHLAKDLETNGALWKGKRYFPKDGAKFLLACMMQFSGGYVRAVPERKTEKLSVPIGDAVLALSQALVQSRTEPPKKPASRRIERDEEGRISRIVEEE